MNSIKVSLNRKVSRYVRRDSQKSDNQTSQPLTSRSIKSTITNINNTDYSINKNLSRFPSCIIRSDYNKRKTEEKPNFNKSSSHMIIPSFFEKDNNVNGLSSYKGQNQIKITQPRTPLITTPIKNINYIKNISVVNNKRSVQTPQARTNKSYSTNKDYNINKDCIKVNNLTYYIRCPYCHHELNQEPKIEKNHNKEYSIENKENFSESFNSDNTKYKTEKKGIKNIFKNDFKNFFINEKGVIVFKQNDQPTSSIKIVKHDFSKYSNESKIFGKKRNISIYESPVPETKVFIRPIKI